MTWQGPVVSKAAIIAERSIEVEVTLHDQSSPLVTTSLSPRNPAPPGPPWPSWEVAPTSPLVRSRASSQCKSRLACRANPASSRPRPPSRARSVSSATRSRSGYSRPIGRRYVVVPHVRGAQGREPVGRGVQVPPGLPPTARLLPTPCEVEDSPSQRRSDRGTIAWGHR